MACDDAEHSSEGKGGGDTVNGINLFASFASKPDEALLTLSSSSLSSLSWQRGNRLTSTAKNLPGNEPAPPWEQTTNRRDGTRKSSEADNGARRRTHPLFSSGIAHGDNDDDVVDRAGAAVRRRRDGKRIERRKLVERWHAFADPDAPIEQRRFQVLILAWLHARCQEPVVHRAMG